MLLNKIKTAIAIFLPPLIPAKNDLGEKAKHEAAMVKKFLDNIETEIFKITMLQTTIIEFRCPVSEADAKYLRGIGFVIYQNTASLRGRIPEVVERH